MYDRYTIIDSLEIGREKITFLMKAAGRRRHGACPRRGANRPLAGTSERVSASLEGAVAKPLSISLEEARCELP